MSRRGEHTYQEIMSQPEAWAEAIEVGHSAQSALNRLWQESRARDLLFTGCGSTYYLSLAAAAWEVLKFIVSDQYQRTMRVSIPESPAARIETAMYGWLDYHTYPDDRSALVESPKYGKQYCRSARYGKELEDIIAPALDPVWLGEATPGEVVPDICAKVDAKIKELRS